MALGDYLRIFRRFWWIVLVAILIGAGVGYATSLLVTPKYSSTARLFVTTQSGSSVGDAYQNNLFSQERVFSYAGLATSEQVAARAIDQLKAPLTTDQLRAEIKAVPLPQTVLLDITVTDPDPAAAQRYANAVADQVVNVTKELETARRGGESAAGAVLVDDSSYGTRVASTGLVTRIALGAVAGAILGILLAAILGVSDTRLRRRERIEEVADSPLLGTLVADDANRTQVIDLSVGGVAVERLRELRTNLQFARNQAGRRPHVIAVTSPSPQDGRSTTVVDLAEAFTESGHSVAIVDGDLINPSLTNRLPLDDAARTRAAEKGLSTVLAGHHDVSEALLDVPGNPALALLPAGPLPATRRQLWSEDSAVRVLEVLRRHFDYVIIDTPALSKYSDGAVPAALGDGAIVLARIGHTKIAELRKALKVLDTANADIIGAVATCEPGHRREIAGERKADKKKADTTVADTNKAETSKPATGATAAETAAAETGKANGSDGNREGSHRAAGSQSPRR